MAKPILSLHLETISFILKSACIELGSTGRAYEALILVEYLRKIPLSTTTQELDRSVNVYVTAGPFGDHTHTSVIHQLSNGSFVPPIGLLESLSHFAATLEAQQLNESRRLKSEVTGG